MTLLISYNYKLQNGATKFCTQTRVVTVSHMGLI